jgi:CheY-like chemotaxis protein
MTVTLLLSNDNETTYFLEESLRAARHTPISLHSMTAALRLLRMSPIQFMFMDLYMTEEDGMSFLRKIVREFPELKTVVFYSGQLDEATMLRAAELLGAHATLGRPLTIPKVREAIQKIFSQFSSES